MLIEQWMRFFLAAAAFFFKKKKNFLFSNVFQSSLLMFLEIKKWSFFIKPHNPCTVWHGAGQDRARPAWVALVLCFGPVADIGTIFWPDR